MTTAALFEGMQLARFGRADLSPSSVAYATASPKGKPWDKTRFMAYNYLNSEKSKAFFEKALRTEGFPKRKPLDKSRFMDYNKLNSGKAEATFEKGSTLYGRLPLGGKLSRQRLMRGDHYDKPKILCSIPKKAERHMARSAF